MLKSEGFDPRYYSVNGLALPATERDASIDQFEDAGHDNGRGDKCWYARDLQALLSYTKWDNFLAVIVKAKSSCQQAGHPVEDHFADAGKMIVVGKGANREVDDIVFSRYGAYLVAQNADARKKPVAFAQTYFAIQTRRQEIADRDGVDFGTLTENQKPLYLRNQVVEQNKLLARAAKSAGVQNMEFGKFYNRGYQGLYGGMEQLFCTLRSTVNGYRRNYGKLETACDAYEVSKAQI